jgi:transposase
VDIIMGEARKRWSDEERQAIVAEAISTGNVSRTARRHGVNPSMVFGWRKRFMLMSPEPMLSDANAPSFAPIALIAQDPSTIVPQTPSAITIAIGAGIRMSVDAGADPALAAAIAKALAPFASDSR